MCVNLDDYFGILMSYSFCRCFCSFLGVYLITQGRGRNEAKEEEFNLPSQINSELCKFTEILNSVHGVGRTVSECQGLSSRSQVLLVVGEQRWVLRWTDLRGDST